MGTAKLFAPCIPNTREPIDNDLVPSNDDAVSARGHDTYDTFNTKEVTSTDLTVFCFPNTVTSCGVSTPIYSTVNATQSEVSLQSPPHTPQP